MNQHSTNLPLSIIVLAHRADDRLQASLTSTQGADEVLLIDTTNSARLQTIAQTHNSTYISLPLWQNSRTDFSKLRNHARQFARHDWVLFLDSDEVIDPSSWLPLSQLVSQNSHSATSNEIFHVRRRDFFHGKALQFGETGNSWHIRFGKKTALQFNRPIHERVEPTPNTQVSQITLNHYPHQTLGEFWQKISVYSEQEARYRLRLGEQWSGFEMVTFPIGKFVWNYMCKLGFLDGWAGLVYAIMMSVHSYMIRVFMYELTHSENHV